MQGGQSSLASLGLGHGESVEFSVRGACMRSIGDGESVHVRRQRLYLPGDVIVVRRRDHWNAHRFLGYAPSVHGLVALTQSDDAAKRDPAAHVSAIVGRVTSEVRPSDRLTALAKYARAMALRAAGVSR
ncbi:MAG: hypothetical protein WBN01_13765 [Polyangiales bacterium]